MPMNRYLKVTTEELGRMFGFGVSCGGFLSLTMVAFAVGANPIAAAVLAAATVVCALLAVGLGGRVIERTYHKPTPVEDES